MASSKYQSPSFRPFANGEEKNTIAEDVKSFEMLDWAKQDRPTYSEIKNSFNKETIKKKDQRFVLSELVAGQLSVEEEDQKRFELRIKEELEARILEIKDQAFSEGFQEGLIKGSEKAFAEEKIKIAAKLESLAFVINDITESKIKLEEEYEQKLTEFAFQIAEAIVESEIKNRPESIIEVVKSILDLLSKIEDVKIYLPISNKIFMEEFHQEISKINRKGAFSVEFKESLQPGDVVIESLSGEVSAKVFERIQSFKKELLSTMPSDVHKKAV